MNTSVTDFVSQAGSNPKRAEAIAQLHQAGHQFAQIGVTGWLFLLACIALLGIVTHTIVKRRDSDG